MDQIDTKMDNVLKNTARSRFISEELITMTRPREGLLPRTEFEVNQINSEEELKTFDVKN